MKKILSLLLVSTLSVVSLTTVISCDIGNNSSRDYISSLPNYEWNKDANGDGSIVKFNNEKNVLKNLETSSSILNINDGIVDSIFDYDKFSTGYKNINFIKKQGVTGAPLVKAYRPNGNVWSDFGIDSASRKYEYINSILTWDKNDLDLDYNKAKIDLASRNFVAKKSINLQQDKVFYNRLQNITNSDSSIVGTKRPNNAMMANFSYVNEFIRWGSAYSNLSWINVPHADATEYLHKNGVESFGMMYFSGWEDVTKEKLKDLFKKDSSGKYKIVDVLIKQCIEFNFDGWFINNEANASQPNGTVLDDYELYEIINQFNEKAELLKDDIGKLLKIIYYKNTQSIDLTKTYGGDVNVTLKAIDSTTKGFGGSAKNNTSFQMDFNRQFPGIEDKFFEMKKDLGESFKNRIYTLYNEERNPYALGSSDYRKYLYQLTNEFGDKNYDRSYNLDIPPAYSMSNYTGRTAIEYFAEQFANYLDSKIKEKNDQTQLQWNQLMSQIISNQYNIYQYTGYNTYISDKDKGYDPQWRTYDENSEANTNETAFKDIIWNTKSDSQYSNDLNYVDIISLDPRFKRDDLSTVRNKISDEIQSNNPQYFYSENSGKYDYSFGLGALFNEMTTITDSDYDNFTLKETPVVFENLKTNFSTGAGMKFLLRDINGKIIESNQEYPWSNNRLADVMPTYQWDFWKTELSSNTIEDITPDGKKNRNKISEDGQLSPYYDYHNPYQKGNAITIGNGYDFDKNGEITPGKWESGKYNLNLMGTNLRSNNYDVEFIVKAFNQNENLEDIANGTKILISTSNGTAPVEIATKATVLDDGWVKISANLKELSWISENNRIAKIGISIDNSSNKNDFNFSIGQFEIKNVNENTKINSAVIDTITNEYTVVRSGEYNTNIRFNWNTVNDENVEYYEIFNLYDNKWFRVGETSINYYYIHNLINTKDLWIGIRPIYKDGNIGNFYKAKFNI